MISSNYTRITFKTVLNSGMDNSLSYRMNFKFYKLRVITSQKLLKKKKKQPNYIVKGTNWEHQVVGESISIVF